MRPKRRHVLPVLALAAGLTGAAPALGADGTRVWMTTGDRQNLLGERSERRWRARRACRRSRSTRPSGSSGSTASAPRSRTRRPPAGPARAESRRDHARPVRHGGRDRPELPASADGRERLHEGPHYTYDDLPEGRPTSACRSSPSPTTEGDPAAAAPGAAPQPQPQGHGHAVEPAGVDEDHRLARRRPLHRRPALLRRLHEVLRQVRPGVRARGRAGRRGDAAERAAEPLPVRIPGMDFRDPRRRG